jgi:hypothetical protein
MRSIVFISIGLALFAGCVAKPEKNAVLLHDGARQNYIDRTPSDVYVEYRAPETNGSPWVRYCIMENGLIYPATLRGPIVVWTNTRPMRISEYLYGGPNCRIPLVECKNVEYTTGAAPHGLRRIETPKTTAGN